MASFDIKSLFTNIPIIETSNIVLRSFFLNPILYNVYIYMNFNMKFFSKMIYDCTDNNKFMFNNEPYN